MFIDYCPKSVFFVVCAVVDKPPGPVRIVPLRPPAKAALRLVFFLAFCTPGAIGVGGGGGAGGGGGGGGIGAGGGEDKKPIIKFPCNLEGHIHVYRKEVAYPCLHMPPQKCMLN